MAIQAKDKERARLLRLDAAVLSRSIASGQFRSLRQGVHGVDFAGVREYTIFDDARQIDWNVTARSAKTYVKLFEEDRDCQIFIILDRSRSMFAGGAKWNAAAETAALAANMRSIRAGGLIFDSEIQAFIPPKAKGEFLTALERFSSPLEQVPQGAGTDIQAALNAAISSLKSRSFIMVLSDWRCAKRLYNAPLTALAAKHDVAAVCITDKHDSDLPNIGSVHFIDAEEGKEEVLLTSMSSFSRKWKKDSAMRFSSWQSLCNKKRIVNALLPSDADPLPVLMKLFSRNKTCNAKAPSRAAASLAASRHI